MTLDLPSTKLKEDQKWVDNIFQLVNKGKQKQAKIVKAQLKKKTAKKPEPDSDKERLHDGVVSVTDTRTLADRLHERLDTMKGERGSGKKRKSPEDDEELKKYISIEKMNPKKKKGEKDDKTNKNEQQKDKKGTKEVNKKQKYDATSNGTPSKNENNKGKKTKETTYFDEDGVEYPMDDYSTDEEGDVSLFDDYDLPDKLKKNKPNNTHKNNNKNNNAPPKKHESISPIKSATKTGSASIDEEENLQFGTFDFSSGKPVPMYLSNKSPRRKNLPRMLKKAEKLQKRLQDESQQGQRKAEQYKWDRMMKKAEGSKVRDNPILLSKKMANIKKQKKKSAIKWEARNAQVERDKDIKFQKKQANIKTKMDRKKMSSLRRTIGASKLKTPPRKSKKSGNANRRAGFEGKKGSFINK